MSTLRQGETDEKVLVFSRNIRKDDVLDEISGIVYYPAYEYLCNVVSIER